MRLALVGMALVGALLASPVRAAFTPEETFRLAFDPLLEGADVVAETETYCLTLALYFEGGSTGETEHGQRHIARVVMERAKADRRIWGGKTLCGVVFYQAKGVCQFSFACLPLARRTPRRGPAWQFSSAIARAALASRNDDLDELIRYYMNSELTPLRNECRFRKEFVPVTKAGRHEFFREPTAAERKDLARAEFDACSRYAALLEAQKVKAQQAKAKQKAKLKTAAAKRSKVVEQKIVKAKVATKPGKVARTRVAKLKR
jgi:hypothetical protein